jgi:hypothetical protein
MLPCLWLTPWAVGFPRFDPVWTAGTALVSAMMFAAVRWPTFGRPLGKAMKHYV